jgi:hypothetical protein
MALLAFGQEECERLFSPIFTAVERFRKATAGVSHFHLSTMPLIGDSACTIPQHLYLPKVKVRET